MERKLDFAYTPREAVSLAYEENEGVWNEIFIGSGFSSERNHTRGRVDKMREMGWDNDKILHLCSEELPEHYNLTERIPLPAIVHSEHPIVEEWGDDVIRKALNRMALIRLAEIKSESFDKLVDTGTKDDSKLYFFNRETLMLKGFIARLTQEATPAKGIRNR